MAVNPVKAAAMIDAVSRHARIANVALQQYQKTDEIRRAASCDNGTCSKPKSGVKSNGDSPAKSGSGRPQPRCR